MPPAGGRGVVPSLLISLVFLSALVTSPLLRLGVREMSPGEPVARAEAS